MSRAQAIAIVDMLRSATMALSDPEKQREYEITLAEAALAEQAKAAPVSDVGALAERLAAWRETVDHDKRLRLNNVWTAVVGPLLNALLSAQEEAAGLREDIDKLHATFAKPMDVLRARVVAAEAKLADAVGELRARIEAVEYDDVGGPVKWKDIRRAFGHVIAGDVYNPDLGQWKPAITSIKEAGDAR